MHREQFFLKELLTKLGTHLNNVDIKNPFALLSLDLYDLLYLANRVRQRYAGNTVKFCSIVSAKSGRCSEDCAFCAQSSHYSANAPEYGLRPKEEILNAAQDAEKNGAGRFGIVTSGGAIKEEKVWEKIYSTIRLLKKETGLLVDASLGCIDTRHASMLKGAGLARYHHNLETSPSFFPRICTTHAFSDRMDTVKAVKKSGMELCCGGIFGIGEKWEDRIALALIIKDIRPDSVPLNFLHPVHGTPLEKAKPLPPQEILRIIAVFRILLPDTDISVCGGREQNLRQIQSWMFYAGANGTMLGSYLTTAGASPAEDMQMISDLGLCPKPY